MRTAQECLLKAYSCEQTAGECIDQMVRLMMLDAARHWRALAKAATPPPEQRAEKEATPQRRSDAPRTG